MARNRPRNIGEDFRFLRSRLPKAPLVDGVEHLPLDGACVLVPNHYERPGLWMGWSGMALGRVVFEHCGRRLRIIAIAEWDDYKLGGLTVPAAITRAIFGRFFNVFGFIPMEPPSAGPRRRAESVRRAIEAVKRGEIIALFPEGDIGETSAMIPAQPGTGVFLLALHHQGAPVIPVGFSETDEGRLHVRIGRPVEIGTARHVAKDARDRVASDLVMRKVACLVPPDVQGVYSD
jgi:1-acyl-sn-glycerol-3-phosphate acyltransferase